MASSNDAFGDAIQSLQSPHPPPAGGAAASLAGLRAVNGTAAPDRARRQRQQSEPGAGAPSSDNTPSDTTNTNTTSTTTKKRKNGPGSRGVANLTPEQLAKKRANGKWRPGGHRRIPEMWSVDGAGPEPGG